MNEAAGYLGVAAAAFVSGVLAAGTQAVISVVALWRPGAMREFDRCAVAHPV